MKKVIILGATGSIGTSTLAVIRDFKNSGKAVDPATGNGSGNGGDTNFAVAGLSANHPGEKILALAREFPQAAIALAGGDASFGETLRRQNWRGKYYYGNDAAAEMVNETSSDLCVAAIGGTAGLAPTFAAANKGLRILLANKEVLVSAGRLFLKTAARAGATVLPLDSEHTALWQCLEGRNHAELRRLIVTASGGPFRTWSAERIAAATPEDALKHPVWRMGAKISIDSATLANKALEVIEARRLFKLEQDQVDILVHPQAAVHGLVEFVDGSILAHLGICDMRAPIAYMLTYPKRRDCGLPRLDLAALAKLEFAPPDLRRFPVLGRGLEASRRDGKYPAVFNAANETAVELFLAGRIACGEIAPAIEQALELSEPGEAESLAELEEIHARARAKVVEGVAAAAGGRTRFF